MMLSALIRAIGCSILYFSSAAWINPAAEEV
jgi:hypothetical protein